jgi:hypothetical protein
LFPEYGLYTGVFFDENNPGTGYGGLQAGYGFLNDINGGLHGLRAGYDYGLNGLPGYTPLGVTRNPVPLFLKKKRKII